MAIQRYYPDDLYLSKSVNQIWVVLYFLKIVVWNKSVLQKIGFIFKFNFWGYWTMAAENKMADLRHFQIW